MRRFAACLAIVLILPRIALAVGEVYPLKKLIVASSEEKALKTPDNAGGTQPVYATDLPLFSGADFANIVEKYIGQPITMANLNKIADDISSYAKAHDRLLTKVLVPNQTVKDGVVRMVVAIGRYNQLTVRGNRWFSSKLLEEQLGIKPGEEIRLSTLEDAINWANTNPFRRVKVLVNEVNMQPGKADLLIGVEERFPWRLAASVDNYGTELLGTRHYTGSVQFGNLWGLDHQGSYQYTTTDDRKVYQAHSFDYRIPLPWRHFVQATVSYVRVQPSFGVENVFSQTGENLMADLRYTVPVSTGDNAFEYHGGVDFKRGNNNLEYAGTSVFATQTDTIQAFVGTSLVHHDKLGLWLVSANINLSPGGVDRRNSQTAFSATRVGSSNRYIDGTVSLQRNLLFDMGWELQSRVIGQLSSTNLLGNEQLTIGGATSVRGLDTNIYAGDQGFVADNDLLSPTITTKLDRLHKNLPPLQTRFAFFYDAGQVFVKHRYWFDPRMTPLAGAGMGVRMSIANNFGLTFDYGWRITRLPYPTSNGRGNIKVVLAY